MSSRLAPTTIMEEVCTSRSAVGQSCLKEVLETTMTKHSSEKTDTTDEGSSLEGEYTFVDANARPAVVRTPVKRLHKVRKLGVKADPDMIPPFYNRQAAPILSPGSPRRKSVNNSPTKDEAELARTFGQSFTFNEVDWNPQQSAREISRESSFNTNTQCWDDESAFDCDSFVPHYVPLDDGSVIPPGMVQQPSVQASSLTSRPVFSTPMETIRKEICPSTNSARADCLQESNSCDELSKKVPKISGASPKKKKIIRVSTKDFAAMGLGDEVNRVRVVMKEHPGHRSLGSLLGDANLQTSSPEESKDAKRSSSPRRRGSFGTAEMDKRRGSSPRRRRSMGKAKPTDETNSREVASPQRTRGGGSESASSGGPSVEKDRSRRSGSPRRRSSIQGSRQLNDGSQRCSSPRRAKEKDGMERRSRSKPGAPEHHGTLRRGERSPEKRTAVSRPKLAEQGTQLHSIELARTVSTRIRNIGITPEQLAMLRKAGLTITDTH